jgi:CO dehydrogenase nickel-insertion accessory protein CooC1
LGGTVFSGGPVTCPVDDPAPLPGAQLKLHELRGRFWSKAPDGTLVFQAGKIGTLGPGAGCDGPMTKIARDFSLDSDGVDSVTLVDFKAGIEDASRGVITSLDWIVLVIDPTYAGLRASLTMRTMLDELHSGRLPSTRHLKSPELVRLTEEAYRNSKTRGILYVLNKMPDLETEQKVRRFLDQAGIDVQASLPDDPRLRRSWLEGAPLKSTAADIEAAKMVNWLERSNYAAGRRRSSGIETQSSAVGSAEPVV